MPCIFAAATLQSVLRSIPVGEIRCVSIDPSGKFQATSIGYEPLPRLEASKSMNVGSSTIRPFVRSQPGVLRILLVGLISRRKFRITFKKELRPPVTFRNASVRCPVDRILPLSGTELPESGFRFNLSRIRAKLAVFCTLFLQRSLYRSAS